MKIILTEKIAKLGNIGDSVEVKTGFARNYLFPNKKAMRFSKENLAIFETKREALLKAQESLKLDAEKNSEQVRTAKIYMIRQAGDTGQLYGSVSNRDIAKAIKEETGIKLESSQVILGSPIKSVGVFDVKIALHVDVVITVKVYVAQTQDEINSLVEGKVLDFSNKNKVEEVEETEEEK